LAAFIKPLLALVTSSLFFLGFFWLTDFELLEFIEAQFYNPSVLNSYIRENAIDAEIVQNHISELQNGFAEALENQAVRNSFLHNQAAEDIYERSRIFGILKETTIGLHSVRFVGSDGNRIHFSTLPADIISQTAYSTVFRNYNEDTSALPFDVVNVPTGGYARFIMDVPADRMIFSFPFYDSMDVYRGTAIFTISIRALTERLLVERRINVNESVSILGNPPGVLLGIPREVGLDSYRAEILEKISEIWNDELRTMPPVTQLLAAQDSSHVIIESEESGATFWFVSLRTHNDLFFGRLISEYMFLIPPSMRILLNLSIFFTFYLTLFFMLNLKPHPATIVKTRIRRLRRKLFEQLYVNQTPQERIKWVIELEQRRDEIKADIKRNLKNLKSRTEKNIDAIIDTSWDELLIVIRSGSARDDGSFFSSVQADVTKTVKQAELAEETGTVEEIEDAEELGETLEEIEEIEDSEIIEIVEELNKIEEIKAEAAEEIEDVEELEEIEEIEEIEDGEAIEIVEELSKIEETKAEVVEEIEVVEELGETSGESLEEIEEIEALEEIEEIEEIEEEEHKQNKSGLLVMASKFSIEETTSGDEEFLSDASKIDYSSIYQTNYDESEEEDNWEVDIDIVSPFSSMFDSLKEKKQKQEEQPANASKLED